MELRIYDDIIAAQEKEYHLYMCGTDGVSFTDIDDFVGKIPANDDKIDMLIHCCGGSVSEGWAMVDKLRATGKTITATIDGTCASMAVSLLLAASERRAQPHATIHIHKPFFPPYTLADAYNEDDLKKMAADLERETAKMLDWYVERTGADRATLEALMLEDKDIDMQQAKELGFVHTIIEPMSASTKRNGWKKENTNNTNTNTMAENTKAGVLNALASFLGLKVNVQEETVPEAVNYVLKTAEGGEVTIEKPEGEEIAVGDIASPDGEYTLEDGRVVVIAEGVITEIKPAEETAPAEPEGENESEPENKCDEDEKKNEGEGENEPEADAEKEALKAENEELKARVAELEAKVAELEGEQPSADDRAIVEKVNKAGGMQWLDKVAKSNYTPAQRKTNSVNVANATMQNRLAELKERKNKSK